MQYVRMYAGPDGESHFEDLDVALAEATYAPPALPVLVSAATPATQCLFLAVPAGWDGGRHPSPVRQWGFILAGEVEFEVSDGEVRRFLPGSVVLGDDLTGKGHDSRAVGQSEVRIAVVHLAG